MLEVELQSRLIDAAKDAGGFGKKLSSKFLVGVSDLLIQLPNFPTVLIECKCDHAPVNESTLVRVSTSPLQRKFLGDFSSAGGVGGVCLFVANKKGRNPDWFWFLATSDILINEITFDRLKTRAKVRRRGQPWPIEEIVQDIVTGRR